MVDFFDIHIDRCRFDAEEMNKCIGPLKNIDYQITKRTAGVPTEYEITYCLRGIEGVAGNGEIKYRNNHQVRITLTDRYPKEQPQLIWLTPIWHPNIKSSEGLVCVSDVGPQDTIVDLVLKMARMVIYANFMDELRDPQPLDGRAADWSRSYRAAHSTAFPLCPTDTIYEGDQGLVVLLDDHVDEVSVVVIEDQPVVPDLGVIVIEDTEPSQDVVVIE